MDQHVLAIAGMRRATCGLVIDDALEERRAIRSRTDLRSETTTVELDDRTTLADVLGTTGREGYAARVIS